MEIFSFVRTGKNSFPFFYVVVEKKLYLAAFISKKEIKLIFVFIVFSIRNTSFLTLQNGR